MYNLPDVRSHQTALVIDVRAGVTPAFKNRYERLLESVNDNNIKVDVFTLKGNNTGGPGLVNGPPPGFPSYQQGSEIDLMAWAKGLGFTQLLVCMPVV